MQIFTRRTVYVTVESLPATHMNNPQKGFKALRFFINNWPLGNHGVMLLLLLLFVSH